MQKNDWIHGFRVKSSESLPEINATMWRMEYEKNGAELVWLDREDDNKTFAIAFKTIPQDSTGVFHILEHSVLNGSEKYPVREPFVELLKSSLSTFLNALTFQDKTMYPVSSRNDQDFMNLMDVYLDAVLHPLCVRDPHAFRQEGWHYELEAPEGELTVNGVVFNEMKGNYADPDSVLLQELLSQLFPDTPYGWDSGGDPAHIPELTYEKYTASHARFYHPSNVRIFLDGTMDLPAVLAKLDAVLGTFPRRTDSDMEIPMQPPVRREKTVYYEIGPEETPAHKALLARGWVYGRFDDMEKKTAFAALTAVLAGSNEAPLKKALLDAELCEDLYFGMDDSIQQNYSYLVLRNADASRREEAWKLVRDTLRTLADGALDRQRLRSVLNRMEFAAREKDFGGMPRGVVFAMQSMDGWLYGGDPAMEFHYEALFRSLREKIEDGWFEAFLREALLDNPHTAEITMLPSKTVGEEKRAAEQERLARQKAGWTPEEQFQVISEFQELRRRQNTPDTPEQLAALPVLSLSDIPEEGHFTPEEVSRLGDGVQLLYHPLETDGITYLDLYFDCSDQPMEDMWRLSLLSHLLGETATENYSPLALADALEDKLGHFATNTTVYVDQAATPYFVVSAALLDGRKADALRLLDEILNRSRFDDGAYLFNLLRQYRIALEQQIIGYGNRYASLRAQSSVSIHGALREATDGICFLRALQAAERGYAEAGAALRESLAALARTVFHPSRLTISLTGRRDDGFASDAAALLKGNPLGQRAAYAPRAAAPEGFVIPAEVGFSARCGLLDLPYSGAAEVASQFLSLDYLWNAVRVQGGAYGTGCGIGRLRDLVMTSFRDPNPAQSLETFNGCGKALSALHNHPGEIGKYAVSALGNIEPVETPRTAGAAASGRTLSGIRPADQQKRRSELLHTSPEDLAALADSISRSVGNTAVCVIGGQNVLDNCKLAVVEPLQ